MYELELTTDDTELKAESSKVKQEAISHRPTQTDTDDQELKTQRGGKAERLGSLEAGRPEGLDA
jgi:hypothetical protein